MTDETHAQCTLCAAEPGADGFYTGCMVKDLGPQNGWDCDGHGNLTRASLTATCAERKS